MMLTIIFRSLPTGKSFSSKLHRSWFYFSVTGVPKDTLIQFTIKNMTNQQKLFSYGMKPFSRILPREKPEWDPIQTPVSYTKYSKDHFEITFSHFFHYSPFEQSQFALCEPHSYMDCQNKLSMLERKLMNN